MTGTPHPNPLEVVEAAVGVVDLAWTAIERHMEHASHDAAWEEAVKLEGQLAQERSENHRLKAALEECRQALQELQSVQASSTARDLPDTSYSPSDLYEQLKRNANSPLLLERLKELHTDGSSIGSNIGEDTLVKSDPEDPSWWLWIMDDDLTSAGKEESDRLKNEGYVIVNQDDVVDGVAVFIAKLIIANPSAKKMTPKEVQEAVSMAFTRLERNGTLRKLWKAAKLLYVSASWTAAAVGLYKNPFIIKAMLKALSVSSRVLVKVLH